MKLSVGPGVDCFLFHVREVFNYIISSYILSDSLSFSSSTGTPII